MNASVLPNSLVGDYPDMDEQPQPKTWVTEISRWSQVVVILVTMFAIGLPIEHRLTAIETKTETANTNWIESVKVQRESNSLSLLSLQTSQTVLEILLKLRLPKDDRKKVEEKLAEIKAKKISENQSDYAGEFDFHVAR